MEIGKMNTFTVLRETEIAYLLTDGTNEVFLHKKEAQKPYEDGEQINVFLYLDNLGRITASTKQPLIEMDKVAPLEVVAIKPKYGVFLYYGMIKDLLLSLDDLPEDMADWPQEGDKVFVQMIAKNSQLFAHIIGRKQLSQFFYNETDLEEKQEVEAYVMYIVDHGIVCYTEKGEEIFVHRNNYRGKYHIGQKVTPKIIKRSYDGEYSATLIEQKELMLEQDALDILAYLESHHGSMIFTDKTEPELISRVFHMSKSAFKRALGSLYKAKKVELKENKTILIK